MTKTFNKEGSNTMANAVKYHVGMSFADVNKAIVSLNRRSTTLKNDIQTCLVAVAMRWMETGDAAQATQVYTRIVNEVEGYYGQAITNYLSSFLKLEWQTKDKSFKYTETKVSKDTVLAMKTEPFWEFSPPAEVKPYVFLEKVEALLAQAVKRSKTLKDGDEVDNTLLNRLMQTVGEYKFEQAQLKGE